MWALRLVDFAGLVQIPECREAETMDGRRIVVDTACADGKSGEESDL